jgi:hypothetical protein
MYTYLYSYRNDSTDEPIGRVEATNLVEARECIAQLKRLSIYQIDELFKIKKVVHGKQDRTISNT